MNKGNLLAVGITAGAGWASRIVTAGAQILSIRLLADMLGVDGYGAFAVVIGLLGWFALADFGFGSGLQNYISRQRVAETDPLPAIVSVAQFLMVTTIALWLVYAAVAWLAGPWLLAGFQAVSRREAALGWFVFAVLATGAGAAGIFMRICFAVHRGYVGHLVSAAGAIGGLAGLGLVSLLKVPDAFVWSMIAYSTPNFLLPALALLVYIVRRRDRSSGLRHFDRSAFGEIFAKARVFLLFNTLTASVLYVDYIIISQTLPARDAAIYAILSRLFTFSFFVFSSVLLAAWPVATEIFHRGDFHQLRRTILACLGLGSAIVLVFSAALYLLADPIVRILSPREHLAIPLDLLPFFTIYWIVRVWCDTFSILVQSADGARALCLIVPVQTVVNLLISSWAASRYGLYGLLVGMTLSFLLTVAWYSPALLARLIRQKKAGMAADLRQAMH